MNDPDALFTYHAMERLRQRMGVRPRREFFADLAAALDASRDCRSTPNADVERRVVRLHRRKYVVLYAPYEGRVVSIWDAEGAGTDGQ